MTTYTKTLDEFIKMFNNNANYLFVDSLTIKCDCLVNADNESFIDCFNNNNYIATIRVKKMNKMDFNKVNSDDVICYINN